MRRGLSCLSFSKLFPNIPPATGDDLVFGFVGIASLKHTICDAVCEHVVFLELLCSAAREHTAEAIDCLAFSAELNERRRADEVHFTAALARNAHVDWHGGTLMRGQQKGDSSNDQGNCRMASPLQAAIRTSGKQRPSLPNVVQDETRKRRRDKCR